MKRFIIAACAAVALGFLAYTAYYQFGVYLDLRPDVPVESFMTVEGKTIYMEKDGVLHHIPAVGSEHVLRSLV